MIWFNLFASILCAIGVGINIERKEGKWLYFLSILMILNLAEVIVLGGMIK